MKFKELFSSDVPMVSTEVLVEDRVVCQQFVQMKSQFIALVGVETNEV
jgi:hypothetical protein